MSTRFSDAVARVAPKGNSSGCVNSVRSTSSVNASYNTCSPLIPQTFRLISGVLFLFFVVVRGGGASPLAASRTVRILSAASRADRVSFSRARPCALNASTAASMSSWRLNVVGLVPLRSTTLTQKVPFLVILIPVSSAPWRSEWIHSSHLMCDGSRCSTSSFCSVAPSARAVPL